MRASVYLFVAIFCCVQVIWGQQTITSATLNGRIEDRSGALVSFASVIATNLATNQSTTTTADYQGRFRFPSLRVGDYSIKIEAPGFQPLRKDLTIGIGQIFDVRIQLEVSGVSADVRVDTSAPLIETARTQVTETIGRAEISDLPLNGRNYLDLAVLIPGVSPTNTGSNQRFAETSAVPGQGISISGQRNLYNSFIVDGMSANDDAADLTGSYYSEEVVDQFQVVTSGGIAEFGRASGGIVNILTKAGTNNWHASIYGFGRNQRFDARNPLARSKDLLTQAQYGASLSGPLRRNESFVFTNFEQTKRNYSAVVTIAPNTVNAINQQLNFISYKGPRIGTGVVPASFDTTNFLVRVDHRLNDHNQLAGRYSLYHIIADNSRTVGGLNAVSRGSGLGDTDQSIQVNLVSTLTKRTLNESRFQFMRSRLDAPINDEIGPAVSISGEANFGTATSSPLARDIDLFEIVDNVSHQRGSHSFKTGVDFLHNRVDILFPGPFQGVYAFNSLSNFLLGNYSTFQQAFGIPNQAESNPNVGMFVQDEWRFKSHIILNAGIRYDLQFLPAPVRTDKNNIAPRLGIAYAPGDRRTIIRTSFGLFYDRVPLRATSNALQRDGTKYLIVQLAPTQFGAPLFPDVLRTQPDTLNIKPNITRIDPNLESSYSEQANLQIEHQLSGNATLSVGYLHLRALHIILARNVNVPTVPSSAGVPNLGRPDPMWGNISRYEASGNSYYDGLLVSFNQRLRKWSSLRVSYTFSKTIDDAGNFFFSSVQNNFDTRDDRGLSDNDQRHRLVLSGSLEAPRKKTRGVINGFQLGYIFTYASRLPFNVLLGSDRNFDTNNNDRPNGVGRNTGRGFDFASLDLRLSRHFKLRENSDLQIIAEGFNILNRSNLGVPNNTFGTGVMPLPTFGQATGGFDPRQFQFGLKLTF
jgi:hypothetical protein